MSDVKEVKQSLLDLASVISSKVQIRNVHLIKAHLDSHEILEETPLKVEFAFEAKTKTIPEDNKIIVHDLFHVFGKTTDNEPKVLLSIVADYLLEYSVESFDGMPPESIEAFGLMNGIYSAWPYWREFVQSMTTRRGLPALTLPVITGNYLEQYYARSSKHAEENKPSTPKAIE